MDKPTVGRIVNYFVSENDTDAIKYNFSAQDIQEGKAVLPAIIVRVWSDTCVNLKVLTDGPVDAWKTSVSKNEKVNYAGSWNWPARS
jgi:hypothetical protein